MVSSSVISSDLSVVVVTVTGRVVLVGLLEGIHGNLGTRWKEGHAAADHGVHSEVVVVVKTTGRLTD